MNINNDPIAIESPSKNAQSLQTLASGPLYSSISSLSSSSQTLPSNQEFHFFKTFDEFNLPIDQITNISDSLLQSIGLSAQTWSHNNKAINFPYNVTGDEAYNWLVDINDEIMQRFDFSIEEMGNCTGSEPDMNGLDSVDVSVSGREVGSSSNSRVKAKEKKKSKIPFHVPTIRKPQEVYKIVVDNSNKSFEHVGLEKSEDGQRFVHPLEKLSVMDFVDKDIADIEPVKPPSIESTPFKLVEEVKDLEELAAKLRSVNEFAVDLEHNQYRSFQGLTCLMQISTRTEDFIIDTLKLRIHVGPYLREVFKDPTKKKVLHGADRDIVWLQRDFGIYICNMFDTGQASRVLKMERNSLEHLLQHFCGVTANKEYQNADWRLRPLTAVMLRYGREDTHYLLYIYDLMRIKLLSMPMEPEHCDTPLVEVYKRSYDVCMQLYEKELLTEDSYLHVYGLQAAGFNANQLAIAAGLCEWRDLIARSEDESTGYILPNKVLLEIAKQMPLTAGMLRRVLKSKQPYVEDNLGKVVSIIKRSIQNAASFEAAAQQLKVARELHEERIAVKNRAVNGISLSPRESQSPPSVKAIGATLQILKKPNRGSGALPGNAATKRKPNISKKKEESKLKQIRSSVNPPFPSFLGTGKQSKPVIKEPTRVSQSSQPEEPPTVIATESIFEDDLILEDDSNDCSGISPPDEPPTVVATKSTFEDVITLEDDSDEDEPIGGGFNPVITVTPSSDNPFCPTYGTNKGDNEETVSLSDLSTSYKPCSQPSKVKKSKEQNSPSQFKPFDFKAAIKFGGDAEEETGILVNFDIQARLRQVFPASGNRNATFR